MAYISSTSQAQKYSFFSNLKITDPGRTRMPKAVNPEGLAVRLLNNGAVYPSKELITKFNLEFKPAQAEDQGNGFDIVDTKFWKPLAEHPRMLMFGVTPKDDGKVDLFATTRHNEDCTPKSNVLTRGEQSPTLLALAQELGWLTGEQKYVDLQVIVDHPFTTTDGIAYIPKVIERGANKGEKDYRRRDNITFYPVEAIEPTDTKAIETKENAVTI